MIADMSLRNLSRPTQCSYLHAVIWSDRLNLDANGFMPLLIKPLP